MNSEPQNTPLAIVGIGCLFPKAAGPGAYWANVKHGVDCISDVPPTHWNPEDYFDADPKTPDMTYARRGGFLDVVDFNPLEFGIAPRDIEATDTTQLLGLVAAKQALVDARIRFADRCQETGDRRQKDEAGSSLSPDSCLLSPGVDRSRVSVILGVTGTLELVIPLGARLGHPKWKRAMKAAGIADEQIEDAANRIAESYVPWQENSFPGLLGNVVAGRIANRLDLGGTNCVVDAACASSLSAVHLAAMELETGRADVVVTGGCDTFNDIFMYMCFSKTPALSPTGNARPFSADGDGTILGEGLGVVVLKRLDDAEKAGDTIYAVIRGIGSSSDGKGNAIYAPSAAGQRNCLRNAYRLADVTPDTIELVEAHGTGTRVGDATEATALTEVYSEVSRDAKRSMPGQPWAALGSVKSQIGHTKAAAGAASLIKTALAIYYKVLPPTIKVTKPVEPLADAESPFYVNATKRPWLPCAEHPRRAALSAFGFGGSNFHAVLEEYRSEKSEVDWDGSVEIVAIGAGSPKQLIAELEKVPTAGPAFARFAEQSRSTFDPAAHYRLTFAAQRPFADLPKLIASAKTKLAAEPEATGWHTSDGVYFGRGPAPGSLAVLFPGQGSQAVGMLRDLACLFPEMLDSLAAANQSQESTDKSRLSDRIYPPTSFEPDAKNQHEAELRQTRNAQPALGAVSFGAWQVLYERFGVKADAFAGHSYGELVALTAAGRLTPAELFPLSHLRGRLMGEQRSGDPGAMLAVLAPLPDIEQVVHEQKLDLVIANKNGPKQTVLSGAMAEIERATQAFAAARMKAVRLPVAAAFHSPLVADAAVPFRAALEKVPFQPGSAIVYANTTAAAYPTDPTAARTLLAEQLAKPVAFVEQIRAMVEGGARTFIEVGPGCVLTRLTEAIIAETQTPNVEAFALDVSGGKRPGVLDLGDLLARLAARGYSVELTAWEKGSRCRPAPSPTGKPAMTVPLNGANYVTPRTPRPAAKVRVPNAAANVNGHPRVSTMPDADPNALAQALGVTQQSLAALQRMQEQTAALHKQFLESQETAQRTLQSLVDQQQSLLMAGLGAGVALPVVASVPNHAPVPHAPIAPPRVVDAPRPPAPRPSPIAPYAAVPVSPPPVSRNGTRAPARDRVAPTLLAVVAEKTGYPVESLDLSLSLDGDLGVDSIKRVEILSALQEKLPDAPVVKPEHLGTLHTLQDVANFLGGEGVDSTDSVIEVASTRIASIPVSKFATPSTDVSQVLLAVVSEKTGYPIESLDLSLSLDNDLGVDSIKRVEILSALQEKLPDAPVVKPEHLGTLHTLQDVASFLEGEMPFDPATGANPSGLPTTKVPIASHGTTSSGNGLLVPTGELNAADTEQTAATLTTLPDDVPKKRKSENVNNAASRSVSEGDGHQFPVGADRVDRSILQAVDLDLSTPRTRIPFTTGGEFWIVGDADAQTEAVTDLLAGHGYRAKAFGWSSPPPTKKPAGSLAGLVLLAPISPGSESCLNRRALEWLKLAASPLRQAGRVGAATFVTVARLDGAFGLADLPADADITSGGLAGLTKTARHEWPEVYCKAIDLSPSFDVPHAAAAALVDEILAAGPIEVGITPTHRCTLELARTVRQLGNASIDLGSKDVILVTGGARGITAEVAVALAETYSPTLILTGRTPLPGPEPAWLAGSTTEAELKKAISEKLGATAGPRQVGEHYLKVLAQREVRGTLDRIAATGAKVAYFPVNIIDGKAVADLLKQVRAKYGPVTGFVHGAGVLADKRIEDLTPDQFDYVYSTKVDGLRNLLNAIAGEELKALVLFSSTTGRFGRTGQAAYACANEVLNKTAQVESRRRPGCRVVAINWGPWDGGMVTPGLRKVFDNEGVGLIPLLDGALFLVQELSAVGKAVEVVALGKQRGGSGVAPAPAVRKGSGGIQQPATGQSPAVSIAGTSPPALELALAFERMVDVSTHPVLKAHVIDGRPVLPMALHLEWLAHAALHGNPGLVFHGFNDLRVTSGVQVEFGNSVQIRAFAGKATKQDKQFIVPVELRGKRKDGREAIHSRAEIVLVSTLPTAPPADRPPIIGAVEYSVTKAYRQWLFHGPALHGIERIDGASEAAFIGTAFPAPAPAEWFQSPLRSAWIADPLVLDASFQMMILWTQTQHDTGSLPCFAGRYRQFRKSFPTEPTTVVIRIRRDDGKFARADVDYLDPDGGIIAQMQDYECVMEKTLNQAFRKNQIVRQ